MPKQKTALNIQYMRIVLTWASVSLGILAIVALFISAFFVVYGRMYENRIFPGVRVLNVRLDGLTRQEARTSVQRAVDTALAKGLRFRYHGREADVDATAVAVSPDASHDLVRFNIDTAINQAYSVGRSDGWLRDVFNRLKLRVAPFSVPVSMTFDDIGISDAIRASFSTDAILPQSARIYINASSTPPVVSIDAAREGTQIVTAPALQTIKAQAAVLDFEPIDLSDRLVKPKLTENDLQPLIPRVESFLARPSLTFTYQKQTFAVPMSMLVSWISVTGTRDALSVTLDPKLFAKGLRSISKGVEQQGKNGSLVVKNGKVQSFIAGIDGIAINTSAMLRTVLKEWPATSTFPLVVKVVPATLVGEDPVRMGITELLGVGTSNFLRSPANRIKNIAHGIALLNGTIIQPGATFSLVKALGVVDGAHHWLPELVIKGNRTTPGFGGGLCQIGTTTFRAALASGLPIVERQNHSYRVVYYEPAGTDATIYDPKPDFRFLNDTGHPILISAFIKGSIVTLEFWGTRDGRSETFTGTTKVTNVSKLHPVVSNITQPPPTKFIETLSLPPGRKKCTERAHAGADADFTYTVTYPNGSVKNNKNKVFHSHYRPWQAVCLIGVKKLSTSDSGKRSLAAPVAHSTQTP